LTYAVILSFFDNEVEILIGVRLMGFMVCRGDRIRLLLLIEAGEIKLFLLCLANKRHKIIHFGVFPLLIN
jgi:hypothetical protein